MKQLVTVAVLTLTMCGLLASQVSGIFVLAACAAIPVVLMVAPADQKYGYWLICQVTAICSIPIIAVQGNSQLIPAILLVTGIALAAGKRRSKFPDGWILVVILYAALGATTLYFSYADNGAFLLYFLLAGTALPTFLIASNTTAQEQVLLVHAIFTFVIAQFVISVYEVFYLETPIWLLGFNGTTGGLQSSLFPDLMRASGTFGHPLPQAMLYVAAFAVARTLGTRISARLRWTIYVVCIAGCVLGSARSALLTIAVIAAYLAMRTSLTKGIYAILSVLAGAYVVNLRYDLGLTDQFDRFIGSGSYTHRLGVIDSLPAVLGRPIQEVLFGHGVRGQEIILHYITDRVSSIDNQYINIIITSGIVGFIAFALLLIRAWKRAPDVRPLLLGFLCMFLSFDVMSWQSTLSVLAVTLGVAMAKKQRSRDNDDFPELAAAHGTLESTPVSLGQHRSAAEIVLEA
ncbi:hypothetical protein [Rhodococcus globerulus]|uniref:hypothetical protein n=1 Tax=Rhodococcus globerulus TaxID=33008 RepID=UPI000B134AEF|nr:hypothetical protein [Rhodococcus globerulus]